MDYTILLLADHRFSVSAWHRRVLSLEVAVINPLESIWFPCDNKLLSEY